MRVYGARDAIAKAFNPQLGSGWDMSARCERGDNCGRIWTGLMLGRIQAAVAGLPKYHQCWALYGYTDMGERGATAEMAAQHQRHEGELLKWLLVQVMTVPPFHDVPASEGAPYYSVLLAVMRNVRESERNGRVPCGASDLARIAGVHRSQFDAGRRWGIFAGYAASALDRLISETLGPVAAVVDQINKGSEAA